MFNYELNNPGTEFTLAQQSFNQLEKTCKFHTNLYFYNRRLYILYLYFF